jgi:hypothetical protein
MNRAVARFMNSVATSRNKIARLKGGGRYKGKGQVNGALLEVAATNSTATEPAGRRRYETRQCGKKQIPACRRQASLRPAPVPQLRDGQEKARDFVRDDS